MQPERRPLTGRAVELHARLEVAVRLLEAGRAAPERGDHSRVVVAVVGVGGDRQHAVADRDGVRREDAVVAVTARPVIPAREVQLGARELVRPRGQIRPGRRGRGRQRGGHSRRREASRRGETSPRARRAMKKARDRCIMVAAYGDVHARRQVYEIAQAGGRITRPPALASPRSASWSRSRRSARSFALASSMTSKSRSARRVAQEPLEADRVDQVGVRSQLRQHEAALDAAAGADAALLDVEPRGGVVDLRPRVRPRRSARGERLAVGDAGRVVAAVMQGVPDDAQPGPLGEREHVGDPEVRSSFSITRRARARSDEQLEAGEEAVQRRVARRRRPDVQHDDRLGAEAHRVEQRGLHLQLGDRRRAHVRSLGVEHRVLAGMSREPDIALARQRADLRQAPSRTPRPGRGTAAARDGWRRARARSPSGTSGCRARRGSRGSPAATPAMARCGPDCQRRVSCEGRPPSPSTFTAKPRRCVVAWRPGTSGLRSARGRRHGRPRHARRSRRGRRAPGDQTGARRLSRLSAHSAPPYPLRACRSRPGAKLAPARCGEAARPGRGAASPGVCRLRLADRG